MIFSAEITRNGEMKDFGLWVSELRQTVTLNWEDKSWLCRNAKITPTRDRIHFTISQFGHHFSGVARVKGPSEFVVKFGISTYVYAIDPQKAQEFVNGVRGLQLPEEPNLLENVDESDIEFSYSDVDLKSTHLSLAVLGSSGMDSREFAFSDLRVDGAGIPTTNPSSWGTLGWIIPLGIFKQGIDVDVFWMVQTQSVMVGGAVGVFYLPNLDRRKAVRITAWPVDSYAQYPGSAIIRVP